MFIPTDPEPDKDEEENPEKRVGARTGGRMAAPTTGEAVKHLLMMN